MKIREDVGHEIKSVTLTVHCVGGKVIKTEETKVRYAIENLTLVKEKIKLVNIIITYASKEHKRANCDSKDKAISWLNLNNTKEQ